jgi:hypothetical protein
MSLKEREREASVANEVFAVNNEAHSGSGCGTSTHTTHNALGSPAKSFASANSTVAEFLQGTGTGAGSETPSTSGSETPSPNASAELQKYREYGKAQTGQTGAATSGGGEGQVCGESGQDDTATLLEEKYGALYDK